jgi:chemotaxis response regulator CheB
MATSEEEIDERPYWGRSASHSSTQTSSSRHTSSSHADEPTADPTFASTSTFDFAAAARATEAPDMAMVVSNDLEGTFESVSLSREATRPPSPRAAEKQRERPPPARARTPPPTVTVEPPPPAANGHAPSLPPPMKPTSKVTVPTTGRTALEKVLSKTRQRDLPPKERKEDNRHLKEYSSMMVQSRENGARAQDGWHVILRADLRIEKRKEAMRRAKRVSKDVELSLHRPTWERGIVPNWKTVLSDPVRCLLCCW